jgi:hypothetical protein
VVLSLLPIGYRALVLCINPASGSVRDAFFIAAGPDHGMHPVPVVPLKQVSTLWGLVINMPVYAGGVWYAPLPATVYLDPRLKLRTPGDMESGFELASPVRPRSPTRPASP